MPGKEETLAARIISLQEAYAISYRLAEKIVDAGFTFDIVIAVARGGLPPARFVCDFLDIQHLTSIQIKHYLSGSRETEQIRILDPLSADIAGKKVLIVHDVNDSGKTLRSAYHHLRSFDPESLKIGVLHEKENTTYKADIVGERLKKWEWLIYQSAAMEDVLKFLQEADMLHAKVEEAKVKYDLDMDEGFIQKSFRMKDNYR